MSRIMSATEARVHFGELLRHVVEKQEPVIVERAGKPQVIVLDIQQYEQLKQASNQKQQWQQTMEQVHALSKEIAIRRKGEPLPAPEEMIRQMREERSEQLLENLR